VSNRSVEHQLYWVAQVIIALVALQVLPILLMWPLSDRWSTALAPLLMLYLAATYPLALLLSYSPAYFLLLAVVTVLILWLLLGRRVRGRWSVVLGAGLLVVWLYASALWYQPPLQAAPGSHLVQVTAPRWWERGLRFNQVMAERTPCTYRLDGWDSQERLYYTAACQGEESSWRFDPQHEQRLRVEAIPSELFVQTADRDAVLERVRAASVRPARHEPPARALALDDAGLVSPGGVYTAVITRHVYSVYDVAVLGCAAEFNSAATQRETC
jgi:hypothetical protein